MSESAELQRVNSFCHIRLSLEYLVRKLGKQPSTSDRLEVAQWWERLQFRVDNFQRHVANFWGLDNLDRIPTNPHPIGDQDLVGSDSEDEDDMTDIFRPSHWMILWLQKGNHCCYHLPLEQMYAWRRVTPSMLSRRKN